MQITIAELQQEPIAFDRGFAPGEVDFGPDLHQVGTFHAAGRAELLEEHRGPRDIVADIRLRASYRGRFETPCARCVEPVALPLAGEFDLIFRPIGVDGGEAERAISTSETEIGYYRESGLALEDVLREQVLLSLPARTLCREDCKGLCPHCGSDRNSETCNCSAVTVDPRWSALGALSGKVK